MTMTSEAKGQLSKTIRSLREKLLTELGEATDREYLLTIRNPKLDASRSIRRKRLEDWLDAQVRSQTGKLKRTKDDFRRDSEKQAAYTLLNRLVILRILEATELRKPKVVTGGWNSSGYKDFRELAPALIRKDDSEGYAFLLKLIFEDLAIDLPGLYGTVGVVDLIPVPSSTIRTVVEALDDPTLESCWTDDMTLGWIYQYWNDPEREALDAKINDGGKIEPHEIASKTQMFTERYMVDWLLQNSLGPMWLAMCKKRGWTPEVEADGTLQQLEERRSAWRAKRDAGEVALTDLMPLETDAERRWAYYVPQPIPDDAVQNAPNSVRDLKILDPAVGSGHFLVVTFDLLFALYQEEARHLSSSGRSPDRAVSSSGGSPDHATSSSSSGRSPDRTTAPSLRPHAGGEGGRRPDEGAAVPGSVAENPAHSALSPAGEKQNMESGTRGGRNMAAFDAADYTTEAITKRILEHNLHGIDLDPRAVQIAAAALWMKAQSVAFRSAKAASSTAAHSFTAIRIGSLNLVASNLGIASLPDNDPSLVELRQVIEEETGIPGKLTMKIVEALRGADHLGSLLKIDQAITDTMRSFEKSLRLQDKVDRLLFGPDGEVVLHSGGLDRAATEAGILAGLEQFLSRHTSAQELGLRLAGEQLAAGVRFVRIVKEGTYDLVVANPPYQGTSKMADAKYVATHYKLAKADLFAAFLLRGLELVREHGVSAMLTMRNWMFIKQYSDLRQHLLQTFDLRALGDFDRGAFEDVPDEVVSVAVASFARSPHRTESIAQCPTPRDDRTRDNERTRRKRAATLCHVGRHRFDPAALNVVPEWPLVYWWDRGFLNAYEANGSLGDIAPGKQGVITGDNVRFVRMPWEIPADNQWTDEIKTLRSRWQPYIQGAAGTVWFEPLRSVIQWHRRGLEIHSLERGGKLASRPQNLDLCFRRGIAFAAIGQHFSARIHRFTSIFSDVGASVFPSDLQSICALMNSSTARTILSSLNPTVHFTIGDVNRLPVVSIRAADTILNVLDADFTTHEAHREPSVEFVQPGPSPWRHAQEWAQLAVDRPEGAPLPEYVEQLDPEPPTDHVSFAVGGALGRFGANGEGILDPSTADLSSALPDGILFLNGSLTDEDTSDSLGHQAARIILDKWAEYGRAIDARRSLRTWLREKFFADVHKGMYENRPIHWPLSSAKKTFVAWVNIHRWNDQTLRVIQGYLEDALRQLDGEINDLTTGRNSSDRKQAREAEQRYDDVKAWRDELVEFIANVEQCSERGPVPPDAKKPEREVDARYIPDLDDGVMVNSSALWPLLDPQWKDPKKWWKELVAGKGKKDYDWSHLAMRYFPKRVDAKCQTDPSLGVAHGCFWKYHPAKAWAWELRLQDEIGPDFLIKEAAYTPGVYRFPETSEKGEPQTEINASNRADYVLRWKFIESAPAEALAAIEKEVLRRRRKQKRPQTELRLVVSGLWNSSPDDCWQLELNLIEKQQIDFRLLSPDEPSARADFEVSNPDLVESRQALLSRLRPPDLYADEEDEEGLAVAESEDTQSEESED